MSTFNLYIGADNATGEINLDLVASIVAENHQAFTLVSARGYWQGKPEPSAIVTIEDDSSVIRATAELLCYRLRQDAVGIQEVSPIQFVAPR